MNKVPRVLLRVLEAALAELPPWSTIEQAHLDAPMHPEARLMLQVRDTLDLVPLPPEYHQFLPLVRRSFENLALECERADQAGNDTRQQVQAWANRLRQAL